MSVLSSTTIYIHVIMIYIYIRKNIFACLFSVHNAISLSISLPLTTETDLEPDIRD